MRKALPARLTPPCAIIGLSPFTSRTDSPLPSLKRMLEAGVHFGHQTRRWNPKMRPYIHSARNGIYLIDLVQTSNALTRACEYLRRVSSEKKNIIFVGTKKQAAEIVEAEAKRCGVHFVNQRWLGGMLTNFETMRLRINRLKELEYSKDTGELYRRPKKELSVLNRELFKLERTLGGIKHMRTEAICRCHAGFCSWICRYALKIFRAAFHI